MTATHELNADVTFDIPVELIDPCPTNRHDDDVDDLADSIQLIGVQQPIRVRPLGDRYEIIAGERRWLACQQLGIATIPAIVDDDRDHLSRIDKRWHENTGRKDFHQLDEASLFAEYRADGLDQPAIAQRVAKTQPYVSERLVVHDRLTEAAKQLWRDGALKAKQALALARIFDPNDDTEPPAIRDLVDHVVQVASDVLDERRDEVDLNAALSRAEAEAKRLRKIANVRAGVEAAGVKVHEGAYKGEQVLGANYGVLTDAEAHAKEPCHRALIGSNGELTYLCVNRDRHRPDGKSKLKASNLTAEAADELADPIATFAEQMEAGAASTRNDNLDDPGPTQDELAAAEAARRAERQAELEREAAEAQERDRLRAADIEQSAASRLAAIRKTITGTRSATYALALLRRQMVEDEIVEKLAGTIAAALDIDLTDTDIDVVDQGDAIRAYVDLGGDNPTRFAMALAYALGERRIESCLRYEVDEYDRRAIRHHLAELAAHGHTTGTVENELIEDPPEDEDDDRCTVCGGHAYRGAVLEQHAKGPTTYRRAACGCPLRTASIEDDPYSPGMAGYGTGPWFTADPDDDHGLQLVAHTPPWVVHFTRDHRVAVRRLAETNDSAAFDAAVLARTAFADTLASLAKFPAALADAINEHADTFDGFKREYQANRFVRLLRSYGVPIDDDMRALIVWFDYIDADPSAAIHVARLNAQDIVKACERRAAASPGHADDESDSGPSGDTSDSDSDVDHGKGVCRGCDELKPLTATGHVAEHDLEHDADEDGKENPERVICDGSNHTPLAYDGATADQIVQLEAIGAKLTPPRLGALRVLAFGAATGTPVYESNTTSDIGNVERLTIYWQSRKWLADFDLIVGTSDRQARGEALELTPLGQRLAADLDVLAGVEINRPQQPADEAEEASAPSTGGTGPADGEDDSPPAAPDVETDPLAVAWHTFRAAQDAAEEASRTKKDRTTAYRAVNDTRKQLAAALVDRFDDYATAVAFGGALFECAQTYRAATGDDADVTKDNALTAAAALLAPLNVPDELHDAVARGHELLLAQRPKTGVIGAIRNLYLNDVLDVLEERQP